MAKGGGRGTGPSNRGMMEAVIFLVMCLVVGVEFYQCFKDWWPIMGKWMERNPVTIPVLVIGLTFGPVTGLLALKSSGKPLGEEAEEIRRGMRR